MRAYGIDWLELFVSESPSGDYSPDGFRRRGWSVREREYGTKTMSQMFTLLDDRGCPFVEVRRAPRGVDKVDVQTVYQRGDAYLRLTNAYCYDARPVELMWMFMDREHYTLKKIYRIDLFLDFVRFDSGDIPEKVVRRIVNHTYAKVNQTHRRTSGEDTWTECRDNWISWGAPKSMVSTKIYDKTKELRDTGMKKPYIIENWRRAGLVDDIVSLTKDGESVRVWRLEFSIKGNAKAWIVVGRHENESGQDMRIPHSLECYAHPRGILNAIANLIPFYFKFRIYKEGVRKTRCKEKVLFDFSKDDVEFGFRLVNTSDDGRIRPQDVSDDSKALYHLEHAIKYLAGRSESVGVQNVINTVMDRILIRYRAQFTTKDEMFAALWPHQ